MKPTPPPVYIVDVNKTTAGQVSLTYRVRLERVTGVVEELRLGRAYLQERLWQETLAPLLWANGWLIRRPDKSVIG